MLRLGKRPAALPDAIPGDPPIPVKYRKTKRASRTTLKVSRSTGEVVVVYHPRSGKRPVREFLLRHEGWIRETLRQVTPVSGVRPGYGARLPVLGIPSEILPCAGSRDVRFLRDGRVLVPGPERLVALRLREFLKGLAYGMLLDASAHYASRIGKSFSSVSVRDTRSRWGSCSSSGSLSYSWRLAMAPPEVLRYVAAHEVAHLAELNHSARFWLVVQGICEDYRIHRSWLRARGEELHTFDFGQGGGAA